MIGCHPRRIYSIFHCDSMSQIELAKAQQLYKSVFSNFSRINCIDVIKIEIRFDIEMFTFNYM